MIFEIFQTVGFLIYFAAVVERDRALNKALDRKKKLLYDRHVQRVNEKILENDGLNLDSEIIIKMFKEIESKRWDPHVFGGGLAQLIEYGCEEIRLTSGLG